MSRNTKPKYTCADIQVYSNGLCYCSVCVPKDMPRKIIATLANVVNPTGLEKSKWTISRKKTFRDKVNPNPCVCNQSKDRLHYLLVC